MRRPTPESLAERARRLLARGDLVEAVRASNRAVGLRPDDRGLTRLRAGMIRRFKEACRSPEGLERVVRADPNLVWFYNERLEAQCCFGRFGRVLEELDRELARDGANARALALKGEVLRMPAFGRKAEAADCLAKACALEPRRAWMRAFLGRARLYGGEAARGLEDLRRAARLDPGCAWIHAWLGEARWGAGDYRGAARDLERAVALDPRSAVARAWRGAALERLGRAREAASELGLALKLHRRYADLYVWPSRSTRDWEELVRIDLYGLSLERGFVHWERARARRALGDMAGAVEDLSAAHRLEPKYHWFEGQAPERERRRLLGDLEAARGASSDPWNLAWQGETLLGLGEPAKAAERLAAALRLKPRHAWALAWRAQARLALGRPEEAARDAERAAREDPACVRAHAVMAQVHQGAGRPAAALKSLGRLLRRDPKSAWAYCWRGELALRLGRPREAAADLDRALGLHPGFAEARFWRAEADRALGRPEKALEGLSKVLEAEPGRGLAYLSRALARRQLGDHDGALEDFGRARRLGVPVPEAA